MVITALKTWLASRKRTRPITTIVLHHDAGTSALASIKHLAKVGLSYHYIIERDGTIHKCVPTSRTALHAGISLGPEGMDVNGYSIGVCLSNRGNGEKYPPVQVESARQLVHDLKAAAPSLKWITTHRLITARKIDPAHFDFLAFCGAVNDALNASGITPLVNWMDKAIGRKWNG